MWLSGENSTLWLQDVSEDHRISILICYDHQISILDIMLYFPAPLYFLCVISIQPVEEL